MEHIHNGKLRREDFHVEKKMAKVLTGVLALSMLSGCGSASKMAMESAYDTLRQTTVLRAVYIMTAATMSMPMKYRKKTARPRRKP